MKDLGIINIADDVVKSIAAKTVVDVPGVYKLAGGVADEFSKILGKKRPSNGIKIEVIGGECKIDIHIIIEYGYPVSDVAVNVQKAIFSEVARLTGLKITEVNIYIQDIKIFSDEEKRKDKTEIKDEIKEETGEQAEIK